MTISFSFLQSEPFVQLDIYRPRDGPVSDPQPKQLKDSSGSSSSQRRQGALALVSHGGGVSRYTFSFNLFAFIDIVFSWHTSLFVTCRSPGAAGQPGDAASSRCSTSRYRWLMDDHPAAAVALHRAAAQRTAPCLAQMPRVWMVLQPFSPLQRFSVHWWGGGDKNRSTPEQKLVGMFTGAWRFLQQDLH